MQRNPCPSQLSRNDRYRESALASQRTTAIMKTRGPRPDNPGTGLHGADAIRSHFGFEFRLAWRSKNGKLRCQREGAAILQ
jgi:hypothetical protein